MTPDEQFKKELIDRLVETTYALRHGYKTRFQQAEENRKFLRDHGVAIDDQQTACSGATVRIPHVEGR